MSRPDVSVIIAVHNRVESLPVLLGALEQQTFPASRYEVIVADNASGDDSAGVAERYAHGAPMHIRSILVPQGGEIAAKNRAAQEADGRWLLFLDQDLLPDARFIESHITAQERHAGQACVTGDIRPHARLRTDVLTRWFLPESRTGFHGGEPRFYEWTAHNLSLPKEVFVGAHGLDEAYALPRFAEADLMIRLQKTGMIGVAEAGARCGIWCAIRLETLRRQSYLEGRAIHQLAESTDTPLLLRHFHLNRSVVRNLLDRSFIPFYIRACQDRAEDPRILGPTYLRILRHDRHLGYQDALRNRPSAWAIPAGHTAEPALRPTGNTERH